MTQVLSELGGLIACISQVPVDCPLDWPTAMAGELADRYLDRDKILTGGLRGLSSTGGWTYLRPGRPRS